MSGGHFVITNITNIKQAINVHDLDHLMRNSPIYNTWLT